jgi:hypothetical protein
MGGVCRTPAFRERLHAGKCLRVFKEKNPSRSAWAADGPSMDVFLGHVLEAPVSKWPKYSTLQLWTLAP